MCVRRSNITGLLVSYLLPFLHPRSAVLWAVPRILTLTRHIARASCTVPRLQVRPLVSNNEDLNSPKQSAILVGADVKGAWK